MENVRDIVPDTTQQKFDDIVTGRILGASNHIRMIAEMFVDIANNSNNQEVALKNIALLSNYFKDTRGKSSYAIINAMDKLDEKMKFNLSDDSMEFRESIANAVEDYFKEQNSNIDLILEYSKSLVKDLDCIMVYDYSSTVEKFLLAIEKRMVVYIPESRVINGGFPFLSDKLIEKHDVRFIADASMYNVLPQVQACFIGAETFYPDGTAFNTVGSDMLAELCYYHNVPYYVLTPLLKADLRALYGQFKEVIASDLEMVMTVNWNRNFKDKVNFYTIELVGIKPERITHYVTEKGILKPSDLFVLTYSKGSD